MSEPLETLEDWAGHLLHRLTGPERRRMLRTIAQTLRRSQQRRIAAQRNPDGTPFAPRRVRRSPGRIRTRKMFLKLRMARHLRASVQGDAVTVGFLSNAARIARVHQYGLRDRVERGGVLVKYRQRRLLGLSDAELETIRDNLLTHLAG